MQNSYNNNTASYRQNNYGNNNIPSNKHNSGRNDNAPAYAGFFVRMWAYIIDIVIVWVGLLIVRLMMSGIMSALSGTPLEDGILFEYTLKDIVLYIMQVLYFILLTYYTGTTLGKKLLNLHVINKDGDDKLKFMDVLFRETIGRFICSVTMCVGYIMVGLDKENRGFHDMLSDTRVVYGKRIKIYPRYVNPTPPPYNPAPNYQRPQEPNQVPPSNVMPSQNAAQQNMPPQNPVTPQNIQSQSTVMPSKPVNTVFTQPPSSDENEGETENK